MSRKGSAASTTECEHEVDFDGPMEYGDAEDIQSFRAACIWVRCKHCGIKGVCVDDVGDFWVDPQTNKLDIPLSQLRNF